MGASSCSPSIDPSDLHLSFIQGLTQRHTESHTSGRSQAGRLLRRSRTASAQRLAHLAAERAFVTDGRSHDVTGIARDIEIERYTPAVRAKGSDAAVIRALEILDGR